MQAYFILSDPWANSYRSSWTQPERLGKFERQIGRGGWIATRNFEVDRWACYPAATGTSCRTCADDLFQQQVAWPAGPHVASRSAPSSCRTPGPIPVLVGGPVRSYSSSVLPCCLLTAVARPAARSGAYFINLLWNYASTPGLWAAASFLNCTLIHDAVALMLDTWATEQHHEEQSPYRYAELPREGRGPKSGYTGAAHRGVAS